MRAIPNMLVVSPCDGPEMRHAVKALLDYDNVMNQQRTVIYSLRRDLMQETGS